MKDDTNLRKPNITTTELKKTVNKCKKIKLLPTKEQKEVLIQQLHVCRVMYNQCVKYNNNLFKKIGKTITSSIKLRNIVKPKVAKKCKTLIKNSKIYAHSWQYVPRDVASKYKAAMTNIQNNNIKHFNIRIRKKDARILTMPLPKSCFKCDKDKDQNGFGKYKLLHNIKSSEKIIKPNNDCSLHYNANTDKFTILYNYEENIKEVNGRYNACALDPGCRKFQTLYSDYGTKHYGTTEQNFIGNIYDKLSKLDQQKDKKLIKQKGYKKVSQRLRAKLKNKIKDLHWKTANNLCKSFDKIFIGNLSTNVKNILSKNKYRKNNFILQYFSHNLFFERLKTKAEEYNCEVILVNEAYTSKTCSNCNNIYDVGKSEVYLCPKCGMKIDRDINGAKNIYLRGLSL